MYYKKQAVGTYSYFEKGKKKAKTLFFFSALIFNKEKRRKSKKKNITDDCLYACSSWAVGTSITLHMLYLEDAYSTWFVEHRSEVCLPPLA